MSGIIYDSSVYISLVRSGDFSILRRTRTENEIVWLSAVVLEELYVGASGRDFKKLIARFENNFEKIGRLIVPNQSDWTTCGQILANIGAKYGFESVGKARMTNDCLIAMNAARFGFTIYTKNAVDFKRIAEFRALKYIVA